LYSSDNFTTNGGRQFFVVKEGNCMTPTDIALLNHGYPSHSPNLSTLTQNEERFCVFVLMFYIPEQLLQNCTESSDLIKEGLVKGSFHRNF